MNNDEIIKSLSEQERKDMITLMKQEIELVKQDKSDKEIAKLEYLIKCLEEGRPILAL